MESDVFIMHVMVGNNSFTHSLSKDVGIGSKAQDLDGDFAMAALISLLVTNLKSCSELRQTSAVLVGLKFIVD